MKDRALESLVGRAEQTSVPLHSLMPHRVRNILVVSSLYDLFTFEEDGELTEVLLSEYIELNLRYAPRIERVSTAEEALEKLRTGRFDLVVTMPRVGAMDIMEFSRAVKEVSPLIPMVLLAYHTRELSELQARSDLAGIYRVFVWHGDARLFLAIIKLIEDRLNAWHDATVAGVQVVVLVEDSISFYSSYIPILYTEMVLQTQDLMTDGLNLMQKLIRMRARPKILLATSYEEGLALYQRYKQYVLGVIVDAEFPRGGKSDPSAGVEFAKMVKEETWDRAVLMQSSEPAHEADAASVGAHFVNKNSLTLLRDVREFIQEYLGFGEFAFRRPDGTLVTTAHDLRSLAKAVEIVPDDSLIYHARRNDFSTWLMARTEFDLARALRPRRVEEFDDVDAIRRYLLAAITAHIEKARAGVVAEFSSGTFDAEHGFVRIGSGSLGGKGRGLAFFHSLLTRFSIEDHIPGLHTFVPPTTVLATGEFDRFVETNGLASMALAETDDEAIARAFLAARIPEDTRDALRTFLSRVLYPLAVRSSSQLEDASHQPFAGVYRTYMLPNAHKDLEVRLEELCKAIKLVYASTFYSDSKSYIESTPNRLEEEKMAVIIQQMVGRRHGDYLYPDIAGSARSYDFYPMEGMDPEDGVAQVALGLGKTVVDGCRALRFSPAHPRRLYQFSSTKDYLETSQREFYALDLSQRVELTSASTATDSGLVLLGLDVAETHGTLGAVGSTYSPQEDAIVDGTSRPGVRLVTMAGVLKYGLFPLADVLKFLLTVGSVAFSCPVEVEFAVNLSTSKEKPHEFGFLQVRPLVVATDPQALKLDDIDMEETVCYSPKALGHGRFEGIRDLVYVRQDRFDRGATVAIAQEIEQLNERLKVLDRPYILVGPGRWGTADRWYGIPVRWAQISGARCMVETDMKDVKVSPSQGSHFFHNITSLGIGYFTVNYDAGGRLDLDWLDRQPAEGESEHVRHLAFSDPLDIVVDSRSRLGVVMKPGVKVTASAEAQLPHPPFPRTNEKE